MIEGRVDGGFKPVVGDVGVVRPYDLKGWGFVINHESSASQVG